MTDPRLEKLARVLVDWSLGLKKGDRLLISASCAATDYVRAFAEQIRAYVPRRYTVLGTDGFGRSDTRENLRAFFEVDRHYIAVAALKALADDGALPPAKVLEAMRAYGLDATKPAPWTV